MKRTSHCKQKHRLSQCGPRCSIRCATSCLRGAAVSAAAPGIARFYTFPTSSGTTSELRHLHSRRLQKYCCRCSMAKSLTQLRCLLLHGRWHLQTRRCRLQKWSIRRRRPQQCRWHLCPQGLLHGHRPRQGGSMAWWIEKQRAVYTSRHAEYIISSGCRR